ncbi:MAG TPA: hypothetical protein VKR32_15655 [Puia sp.]|nr:hypothetical protein [Puia sp.]
MMDFQACVQEFIKPLTSGKIDTASLVPNEMPYVKGRGIDIKKYL